jgi:hypothetical protein
MRNFKIPDNFPKEIIKESLGRPALKDDEEGLLVDEDEEILNKNNPYNKYVRDEDIADNSYLSYGEGDDDNKDLDEENYILTEEEIEEEAREKERALSFKKQLELEWAENHPEVKSVINGEVAHSNSRGLVESLNGDSKVESLNEEALGIDPISRKMRAEAYIDYGRNSKIDIRRGARKNSESCRRDNLKTELPLKKERRSRGLLRGLFKN